MIIIQSNSITVKDGKVLMNEQNGKLFIPGGIVLDDQDPEEVCAVKGGNVKILEPLHPSILWKTIGKEKIPFISLNYLTEKENV